MSSVLSQRDRVGRFAYVRKDVFGASFCHFSKNRIHERSRRTLSRRFDQFHTFEDRGACWNSGKKLQLIPTETQRSPNFVIQPLDFLRGCGRQSLVEQRLPAENSHHQLRGEPVIAGRKLREGSGMEQFGGVGVFALDAQKNFESRGTSRRNGHGSLLSQMIARFGPVAVDKFLRGHGPLAFELDLDEFERCVSPFVSIFILAATNEQAWSLDGEYAGGQLNHTLHGLSLVHLQRFASKGRERPRPRLKTAQAIEQVFR